MNLRLVLVEYLKLNPETTGNAPHCVSASFLSPMKPGTIQST